MNERNEYRDDPFGIRRMSPAEWSVWRERILREARAARSAAMGALLARAVAAPWRGVIVLASAVRAALAFDHIRTPARQPRPHDPIGQNHR